MAKDVTLEIQQLIQRGFAHYEHSRIHDAVSDWETALHLQPGNIQAKRLFDFAKVRVTESDAGQRTPRSRRDTVESPIPQFLAALTERKSGKISVPMDDAPSDQRFVDSEVTARNALGIVALNQVRDARETATPTFAADAEPPDTLENLTLHAADLRASTGELIVECRSALNEKRIDPASLAAEMALQLAERTPPPGLADIVEPARPLFERAFRASIGNRNACPIRAIPVEMLCEHDLDQRAAFLMSRMDAMTSLTDLIDSSGMIRFDALRVLSALRRARAIDILPPL